VKKIIVSFIFICLFSILSKADIARWIDTQFARGAEPPFSFVLDGKPSSQFIKSWTYSRVVIKTDNPDIVQRRFTYSDPRTGLSVQCDVKGYKDFEAVEWVINVKNTSAKNSGRLSQMKSLDLDLKYNAAGDMFIHYAEGNKISKADYAPRTAPLAQGEAFRFVPAGGRSSSEAFPFFNVESPAAHRGAMVSIGWTGTWFAEVLKSSPSALNLSAGQLNFDLFLYPGEEIRTPSTALLFWEGDRMNGHNGFRRFVIKHHSRTIDGKVDYPLCSGFNYRDPQPFGEYSAITADWAVAMIERYAQFEVVPDVFWMDAGWHTGAADYRKGQNWASTTGNWTIDPERFPEGMKPISDAAHRHGAKFMLWFEPERVVRGTQWAVEHKDWMLDTDRWPAGSEESTWLLFDLSKDEACDWLCKYYGDLIEQNGIDYYRQDCNVQPANYWLSNEEPGRSGMKEIRYVCNLYRFWDYLLERFPGLLIDNCASGGKRLDWETIGRSAPLWRSDYYHYDDPDGYQCHTYGLNFFLPVHGTGILQTDQYSFRSSLSSTLVYNWKVTEKEYSIIDMQQRIAEYRSIKPYYYEDYYPLSGTVTDLTGNEVWLAYQMHRSSDNSGIVLAFRRSECPDADYDVTLGGLDADTIYEFKDEDTGRIFTGPGSDFSGKNGVIKLHLDNPRSSLLLKYHPVTE